MSSRSKSSARWLKEHFDDPYVKQAQKEGYRSRAAYKLLEIQKKFKLLKPGQRVIDLGAAPGSWCQVIQKGMDTQGQLIAVDILPMEAVPKTQFIQGDFSLDETLQNIQNLLNNQELDIVLSDISPNMSGSKTVDSAKSLYLGELCLDFCLHHLKQGGHFIIKAFQGPGFDAFAKDLRSHFKQVHFFKPAASRGRSPELYLVCLFKNAL